MSESAGRLTSLLQALAAAVDSDAGAWLFLDDGEGRLRLAAQAVMPRRRFAMFRLPKLLRRGGSSERSGTVELILVPDVHGGVLALERSRSEGFSSEDRA